MSRIAHNVVIALLVLLCFATRIPQLVSDKLLLDGDESVVAIMAKHMLTGKDFSFYFYGQQYGLAFIECFFIMPFYLLLGVNAVAVKLGMLTLWTLGVVLLYRFLRLINKGPDIYPILFILLFICAPGWAVWSMKARGGYLTAFAASSGLLCLLFSRKKTVVQYLFAGLLLALIYESQRIWLPGLLPFIIYALVKDRKPSHYLSFLLPAAALLVLLYFYKQTLPTFGEMPMFLPTAQDLLPRLQRMPYLLYSALHGNFYFDQIQKPNFFCALFAALQSLVIVTILLMGLYNVITRRRGWTLFNVSALSVLMSLLVTMLAHSKHARYLLPVTGFTIISSLLLVNLLRVNLRITRLALTTVTAIGLIAVLTFFDFEFMTFRHKKLTETLHHLENKGIKHVYTSDNMFMWQILFYSNERIIAREKRPPGRYPEYQHKVDSAFHHGANVAYFSYPLYPETISFPQQIFVNDFLVVEHPPAEIIENEFKTQR